MVERNLAKVDTRVRFPSLAPENNAIPDEKSGIFRSRYVLDAENVIVIRVET